MNAPLVALAAVATIVDSCRFWPQAIRAIRTRDHEGVSSWSSTLGAAGATLWCVYATRAGVYLLLGSNLSIAAALFTLALVTATSPGRRLVVVATLAAAALVSAALPLEFVMLAVIAEAVLGNVPFAVSAYRAPLPTGVSPATWWASAASGVVWLVLGVAEADVPTVVWALVTLAVAGAILLRLRRVTSARPQAGPDDHHCARNSGDNPA